MTAIGVITHLPEIKAKKCAQCGEWFYYKRLTAKYCPGGACRKQASRGVPPDDKNPHILTVHQKFAALIAENNPLAFKRLEKIRDVMGERGVKMCIEVLMEFCE